MKYILIMITLTILSGCQTLGGGLYNSHHAPVKPIFIDGALSSHLVYVEYSNSTNADFTGVRDQIILRLKSKGVHLTHDDKLATLILKAKTYRMQAKAMNSKGTFMGAIAGALLGKGRDTKKHIRNGAMIGMLAGAAMDDRDYEWTTEIVVMQMTASKHRRTEYGRARNGYATTSFSSTSDDNWKMYRTESLLVSSKKSSRRLIANSIANIL
jgi:hypothetical protein